jgi:hypothetical protein
VVTPAASVRTFELFSRVLNCASRGQLTPATIDATLRDFAVAHGTEYTEGLARVAEDFVNGLIDAVNGRSVGIGRSETTGPTYEGTAPTPELYARLIRLYFELLTRFADLQTTQINDCLAALLGAADDDAGSGALALRAPVDDTATASLMVENSGSESIVVGCLATAVRRADGIGPAFVPALALTPAEQTLAPGEETQILTTLRLDAGVYEPDVLYIGALRLMRQETLHLEVPLHITATRSTR